MSGTDRYQRESEEAVEQVLAVLERREGVNVLGHLRRSMAGSQAKEVALECCAIGLDSSVFLRLGGHKKSADLIDYLSSQHIAPLVVPAQTVQEFWNNQLSVINTISDSIKKRFDDLEKEVLKISDDFGDFSQRMGSLIEEFRGSYGYIFDEKTIRNTESVIEMLESRGRLIEVPQARLRDMAEFRNSIKTPPGFRDDGDGDFVVWVEFLVGLLEEKERGGEFEKVVLVTNDQKKDWSRGGQAHPVLAAEVEKLLECPLDIWPLDRFALEVEKTVS